VWRGCVGRILGNNFNAWGLSPPKPPLPSPLSQTASAARTIRRLTLSVLTLCLARLFFKLLLYLIISSFMFIDLFVLGAFCRLF